MPFFKSTYNILKKQDEDEVFDENWMDSNKLIIPQNTKWDYSRKLTVEDVDIWEVIYEGSGGIGVYASYNPYAEFYMITTGINFKNSPTYHGQFAYYDRIIETYYGYSAQNQIQKRMIELNIPFSLNYIWVEEEDLEKMKIKEDSKLIIY